MCLHNLTFFIEGTYTDKKTIMIYGEQLMRILHFGYVGLDNSIYSLLEGFRKIGHEVLTCPVVEVWDTGEVAERAIKSFTPNMVMTVGVWHNFFNMEQLQAVVRKYNLPHIYWAIDDPVFFDCISSVHLGKYDFVITPSKECVAKYAASGTSAIYLPFSCNPDFDRKVPPLPKYENDIVVVSNYIVPNNFSANYPERYSFRTKCFRDLIEPLIRRNYDLKIYGIGWDDPSLQIPAKYLGGQVEHSIVPTIYSSVKIALTIQWNDEGHVCHKTFEILGCGCMQIAPYTSAQAEFFIHGIHLLYSRSPEETVSYVNYYLYHEDERKMLASRGQEEVYRSHTCVHRAIKVMAALKANGIAGT